ncbi:YbdK family carboxylate-amine ligase [Leucobacter zeae]|nr:YbdK family carboxylate-amine ligase [Leucobacter zeae]
MRRPRVGADVDGPRRFGIEEEYLLLDRCTAEPANRAAELLREAPEHREAAEREFFSSQLETATPVCTAAEEAEASLAKFRAALSVAAARHDVVLAGTGLPPAGGETAGSVTPRRRYREIRSEVRSAAARQYVTGTHVHVEIPSREAGVEVLARLARWAPALIALTANSPIWCGAPTGFASWRHIKSMAWPLSGYPPEFADGAEYAAAVERLVASGVILDPGLVTWVARLSENFPTIELRIADAQLRVGDAVEFALLVRALVAGCLRDAERGVPRPRIAPGMANGAIWMAARDGLGGDLIDPETGARTPAFEHIDRMVESVAPELQCAGDLERVEHYLERRRAQGSPAERQLLRFRESGLFGLLDLYRAGTEEGIWSETEYRPVG